MLLYGFGFFQEQTGTKEAFQATIPDSILYLSAEAFDKWVEEQFNLVMEGDLIPDTLLKAVISRLKKDMWTSDYAVIKCANSWLSYDNKKKADIIMRDDGIPYEEEFRNSVKCIDSILPLLYKRDLLKMKLLDEKLRHLVFLEDDKEVLKIAPDAIIISEQIFDESNKVRLNTYMQKGLVHQRQDNCKNAEKCFSEVLEYPFDITNNRELRWDLEGIFIKAGRGRIECRSDNLELLKHTFFLPVAEQMLEPIKREAIRRLEEKNKKD